MGGNETTFLAEDSSSCRNVGVNVKARRSFNGRGGETMDLVLMFCFESTKQQNSSFSLSC